MSMKIIEHRFIKVNYESFVDKQPCVDYLHVTDDPFHGHTRHDGVLISAQAPQNHLVAWLLLVFTIQLLGHNCHIALVQYLDSPGRMASRRDQTFSFYRVCQRTSAAQRYGFIPAVSIIRGVPLIPDFSIPNNTTDFLLWNTIDSDMFLQIRSLCPAFV